MGLYDYITVHFPLPAEPPPPPSRTFQTKAFEAPYMEQYIITDGGALIHKAVRYEDVPKAERPYPDAEPGTLESIIGIIRSVPIGDEHIPYDGDIEFYEFTNETWWEYVARFTEGKCEWIRCVEYRPPSPDSP